MHLDSGGFVAASHFGDFPFVAHRRLDAYVDLAQGLVAAGASLGWWATADLCVETELATTQEEVLLRIQRNAWVHDRLVEIADHRAFQRPLPVLQGRTPTDYLRSFDALFDGPAAPAVPALLGVGSMCRRHPNDVLTTLDALDRQLPAPSRLHLFGVTSAALSRIAGCARVASTDSCAYDLADRKTAHLAGSKRTDVSLTEEMAKFVRHQRSLIANADATPTASACLPLAHPLQLRTRDPDYRLALLDLLHSARNGESDPADWHASLTWGLLAALSGQPLAAAPPERVQAAVADLRARWGLSRDIGST